MTESLETDLQDSVPVDAVSEQAPEEDSSAMLPKSTVSKIIERERMKAYEKGKSEALMELQAQQQPQEATAQQAPQQAQSIGGMTQMSPDEIRALIAQQVPQHLQQQVHQMKNEHMVNNFVSKMQAAEEKYPGLEEKLGLLDYSRPNTVALVEMASQLDNAGDIMHELLENPEKMSTLFSLIQEQPRLAMNKLQSLGNSIKQNQEAQSKHESAKDPLGQIRPSTNAGMDNGEMSVSDYSKYWRQNKL